MIVSFRRTALLAVVGIAAALGLLTAPAQAGSSGARLSDPAGDIVIPSLDVVSGLIRLDDSGKARTLTMSATMTGALLGVPADYDLFTGSRQGNTCLALATRVRWNGVTVQQAYQRTSSYVCNTEVTPAFLESAAIETAQYAIGGDPVSATGGGRTVTVNMVAPVWLRTGSLASFGVLTHTPGLGFSDYFNGIEVRNYDMAGIARDWRVG